jgi:hypothetical protein
MDCKYCGEAVTPHHLHLCKTDASKLAQLAATRPPTPQEQARSAWVQNKARLTWPVESINCFTCHEVPTIGVELFTNFYICKDCFLDFAWHTELGASDNWDVKDKKGTQGWSTRVATARCCFSCVNTEEPILTVVLDLGTWCDYRYRFKDLHPACLQGVCKPTSVPMDLWQIREIA